jgi:hypothetical protein
MHSYAILCATLCAGLFGLQMTFPASVRCEDTLRMVFREKPPYSYTENGVQKGFLLERTRQIVNKSGLKVAFEVVPAKRIFAEIEANAEALCSF